MQIRVSNGGSINIDGAKVGGSLDCSVEPGGLLSAKGVKAESINLSVGSYASAADAKEKPDPAPISRHGVFASAKAAEEKKPSPLFQAMALMDDDRVEQILGEEGINVNAKLDAEIKHWPENILRSNPQVKTHPTPLIFATRFYQFDPAASYHIIKMLLKAGANIDMVDDLGKTALHWAAKLKCFKLIELYLSKKPTTILHICNWGLTVAQELLETCSEACNFTHESATYRRDKTIELLVKIRALEAAVRAPGGPAVIAR